MFSKLTSILQHAVEAVRPSGVRRAAGRGEGGCGEAWAPSGPLLSRPGPGGSRGLLAVNLRGYVASAAQDKRTAVPVGRARFCFATGGRGTAGTTGPGPHQYRPCQLGPSGPPRADLGDRSAGVCGSAIAQLTPSVSLFLSVMRFLEALGAACNRCTLSLVLNSTGGQNSNRQTYSTQEPRKRCLPCPC